MTWILRKASKNGIKENLSMFKEIMRMLTDRLVITSHWNCRIRPKVMMTMWQQHLPQLWCLLNKKCDNKVGLGTVHWSGIYSTIEKNSGKPQLGDCLKEVWPIITSDGVPLPNEVGSINLLITKEKERKNERAAWTCIPGRKNKHIVHRVQM